MTQNNVQMTRRSFLSLLASCVTLSTKTDQKLPNNANKLKIGDIVSCDWICNDELDKAYGQRFTEFGKIVGKIENFSFFHTEQRQEDSYFIEYLNKSTSEPDCFWESELTFVYRKET